MRKRTLKARLREELKDRAFKRAFDEEDVSARLALRIAALREERGLTQTELAKRLKVTQQALSLLEDPASARFTIRTLQRLSEALGCRLTVELK